MEYKAPTMTKMKEHSGWTTKVAAKTFFQIDFSIFPCFAIFSRDGF